MAKINVFISWSGNKSKIVAQSIHKWLPSIIPDAETFFSPQITGGSNWLSEIGAKLKSADFGIICVSSDNLKAPWLNFEMGALWKGIGDTPVYPLLIDDIDELTGPSAIFQAKHFNEEEIKQLCKTLAEKTSFNVDRALVNFEAIWPRLYNDVSDKLSAVNIHAKEIISENKYGIKIISPVAGASTFNPIDIHGTYELMPPENSIWVIEYSPQLDLYWPKHKISFANNKEWFTQISIGGSKNEKKIITVVSTGADGKLLFEYSRKIFRETSKWPGINTLTSDVKTLSSVMVMRGSN